MDLNISFYHNSDYPELISVLKQANLYDEVWEAEENISRKIERDPESILVAKVGDELVGCVFIMEDGWNAIIWRLAVKEKFRNLGIGKQLMRRAEEIIR